MKSKTKLIAITLPVVIALIAGGIWWARRGKGESDYREVKVERGTINVNVLATGQVMPENRLEVKPPIPGRAEKVLVKEGDNVRKGQPLVWMSSTERAALLDAARARGPEELARWEELYKPAPILAPITGTIILKNIEPGQTFATTDAILVMSDRLTVQAQVDETDIGQVHVGQSAIIVLDAYPGEKIDGKVDKIAFEAKTVSNVTTYIVTLTVEKIPEFMRSGMTSNVTFNVAKKDNVLIIPAEAVKTRGNDKTVQVRQPDSRDISEKRVTLGTAEGRRIEVISGLDEGDVLLVPKISAFLKGKPGNANPFNPMGNRSQQQPRPTH